MPIWIKVICFALLASTTLTAQKESVIPVVGVSDAGAPLSITGHATARDEPSDLTRYSFECRLDLTNVSNKPILLTIVKVDVVSAFKISVNYSDEDDYFFEPQTLQPGSTANLHRFLGKFGEPTGPYGSLVVKSSARARVAFVQFLDGSSWGNAAAAEPALRNRKLSLAQLEILRGDYLGQGDNEFLKALAQPTLLRPIADLQDLYSKKKDSALVFATLNDMLENARNRPTP